MLFEYGKQFLGFHDFHIQIHMTWMPKIAGAVLTSEQTFL